MKKQTPQSPQRVRYVCISLQLTRRSRIGVGIDHSRRRRRRREAEDILVWYTGTTVLPLLVVAAERAVYVLAKKCD